MFSKVTSRTRGNDKHFHSFRGIKADNGRVMRQIKSSAGSAKGSLRISHHRQVLSGSSHPACGAKFSQCLGVSTGGISSNPCCLSNDTNSTSASPSRHGMAVGLFRVLVE
jgi:hypothetical protein